VVSFTSQPFIPGVRVQSTHCTGAWVGPRAGPDVVAEGEIPVTAPAGN